MWMLLGALLLLSWLVLLLRYPRKALPISAAGVLGLALVASLVLWQEARDNRYLAQLQLELHYAPEQCSAQRPLAVTLSNASGAGLLELHWQIAAYRPNSSTNLAERPNLSAHYSDLGELPPNTQWHSCLPLPALRSGYRASTLEFRPERLQGRFND